MQIERLQFRGQGRKQIVEGLYTFHNPELEAQVHLRHDVLIQMRVAMRVVMSVRNEIQAQDQRVHQRHCLTVGARQIPPKLAGLGIADCRFDEAQELVAPRSGSAGWIYCAELRRMRRTQLGRLRDFESARSDEVDRRQWLAYAGGQLGRKFRRGHQRKLAAQILDEAGGVAVGAIVTSIFKGIGVFSLVVTIVGLHLVV